MSSEGMGFWVDWIAQRLIHFAARRAPEDLTDRLEEEWLADSAAQREPIPRLRFAIGCCWAMIVIALEHDAPKRPATVPHMGQRHFIRFPRDEWSFLTGGTIAFMLLASLQTTVLYRLSLVL